MPDRVREAPGANVTDETRQEAMRSLAATLATLKQAQSEHANNAKKWQKEGIKTRITLKVLRERYKDPAEVLSDLHEEIRLRALSDIPTIQRDLAELWVQPDVPQSASEEHQRWLWREAGALAGRKKFARDSNPWGQGSEANVEWDRGWLDSPERIAAEMEAGGRPQVTVSTQRPARRRTAPAPAGVVAAAGSASGNGAARRRRIAH